MRIIAGEWRGRQLAPVRAPGVRPTSDRVREAWMSAMGGSFDGCRVLDLFAGSGALGLECLSRGAEHCTFVEKASSSRRVLDANVALLGARARVTVVQTDVLAWLDGHLRDHVDLALADPPYGEGWAAALLDRFLRTPFARELWVEHRSDDPVPAAPGLVQRRYGDTVLSTVTVDA
jgi:16S rRNA (guanine966-N2)-methyltransferase